MPATHFICPNGEQVPIAQCLHKCLNGQRCMFLPTLRAISKSLERNISELTVTELISGVRETYLKRTTNYAVDPLGIMYALQGQAIHSIHEGFTEGAILSEIRLKGAITSGKFDLYGRILDDNSDHVLGDLKVTSSYKLMKALGIYKIDVPTGEIYKSGMRAGQPKYRKEFRYDGVRDVLDWSIQLNYYRTLLEDAGFKVERMVIQAICRDSNLKTAAERGIDRTVYLIPINRISDHWLKSYFSQKAVALNLALLEKKLPPVCKPRERWNDKKCEKYCAASEHCPYAKRLLLEKEGVDYASNIAG